jgi:hypothetical protein
MNWSAEFFLNNQSVFIFSGKTTEQIKHLQNASSCLNMSQAQQWKTSHCYDYYIEDCLMLQSESLKQILVGARS